MRSPAGHDPEWRLNPLQQLFYNAMIFVILPALLLTEVGLHLPELVIPATLLGMPAERVVALVHTVAAYLSAGFLVIHVYLRTTGEDTLALFRSMVTGVKRTD